MNEEKILFDATNATGEQIIKATYKDKIANMCTLNKEQCKELVEKIEKQQDIINKAIQFVAEDEFVFKTGIDIYKKLLKILKGE